MAIIGERIDNKQLINVEDDNCLPAGTLLFVTSKILIKIILSKTSTIDEQK